MKKEKMKYLMLKMKKDVFSNEKIIDARKCGYLFIEMDDIYRGMIEFKISDEKIKNRDTSQELYDIIERLKFTNIIIYSSF